MACSRTLTQTPLYRRLWSRKKKQNSSRRVSQTRLKDDFTASTPDMLAKLARKKGRLIKDEILPVIFCKYISVNDFDVITLRVQCCECFESLSSVRHAGSHRQVVNSD